MYKVYFSRLSGLTCILLTVVLGVQPAAAGQIYGTVKEGNVSVRDRVVKIYCPDQVTLAKPIGEAQTDAYGSYSIYVDFAGRCAVTIDDSDKLVVPVYEDEIRHDFRIVGKKLERS